MVPPPVPPNKSRCWRQVEDKNEIAVVSRQSGTVDSVSCARVEMDSRTRRLALVALLSSLYVVANAIPIDAFIGGAGFITAGIILLPVLARLLRPKDSIVMALLASLGLFVFQLSVVPVFGFYGLLIPSSAIVIGSLGTYRSYLYPLSYILFGATWYILFSGGTLAWLVPYLITILLLAVVQSRRARVSKSTELVTHCLGSTMCELVTLNVGSVSLLHLPSELWTVITPLMFLERTVAVVGGSSILIALVRVKGVLRLGGI